MIPLNKLEDGFYAAPQITESDFEQFAANGIRTVVNNRPDDEEPGQLSAARARELAEKHGIEYHHIPMTVPTLTPELIDRFEKVVTTAPRPIVAHCRSGTRSCILWSLTEAGRGARSVDETLHCAATGGYDLSQMRPMIETYAASRR